MMDSDGVDGDYEVVMMPSDGDDYGGSYDGESGDVYPGGGS